MSVYTMPIMLGLIVACIVLIGTILTIYKNVINQNYNNHKGRKSCFFSFSCAQDIMALEIERARRLEHPLIVMVIRMRDGRKNHFRIDLPSPLYINGNNNTRLVDRGRLLESLCNHSELFRDTMRAIDIGAYDKEKKQFVILLPNSQQKTAALMIARIKNHLGQQIAEELEIGISEYPSDGLFIQDLIQVAERNISAGEKALGHLGYQEAG